MSATREVITLQIGHYANFVGTHWWNLQESSFLYNPASDISKVINHEVLFREGQTLQKEVTFTPRLIAIDLKGSLNTLRPEGILYDISSKSSDVLWGANLVVHKVEPIQKNEFLQDLVKEEEEYSLQNMGPSGSKREFENVSSQLNSDTSAFNRKKYNLDASVGVWTDFLRLHLHPKTILLIPDYIHESEFDGFNVFGYGVSAVNDNQNTKKAIEDKLHFYSEECDHLQGFQIILDPSDGFGGVATSISQLLAEEFPSKGTIAWSVDPVITWLTSQDRCYSCINTLITFEKMCSFSSLFSPLSLAQGIGSQQGESKSFPHLNYKSVLKYHSSAVLGTYLDTITLPYRLEVPQTDIRDMVCNLSCTGKNIVLSSIELPFCVEENSFLSQSFDDLCDSIPWQYLTPNCCRKTPCQVQNIVLRGVPSNKIFSMVPSFDNSRQPTKLYQSSSGEEMLKYFISQACPGTVSACSFIDYPCKIALPYPDIFDSFVTKNGLISNMKRPVHQNVEQVPVISGLHASEEINKLLHHLCLEAKQYDIRKCHKFLEAGLELDEYEEILNHLENLSSS